MNTQLRNRVEVRVYNEDGSSRLVKGYLQGGFITTYGNSDELEQLELKMVIMAKYAIPVDGDRSDPDDLPISVGGTKQNKPKKRKIRLNDSSKT